MAKIKQFSEAVWVDLAKRLSSLAWRVVMMFVAILIDVALQNLVVLELDGAWVVLFGLVLGEISKQIANSLKER